MKEELFKKAFHENSLIGIRTIREEYDETIIGYITNMNESVLTLNEVDEYGFYIGFTQFIIDDITDIEINDGYQKRFKFIIENNSLFNPNTRNTIWKEGELLLQNLPFLIEKKEIVTLHFHEDNFDTGIILQCNKSYVILQCITRDGEEDGISYYPVNNLIGIRYAGLQEQKIKLLYENRGCY